MLLASLLSPDNSERKQAEIIPAQSTIHDNIPIRPDPVYILMYCLNINGI